MAFDKPSVVEVKQKDLTRLHGLVERLKNSVDDPYLDEMQDILRKVLRLDEPRHETMD